MKEETFTWKGYEWRCRERWGNQHPDKPWTYYSKDCVNIDKNGNLVLTIDSSSKPFPMGLVSTTENNPKFGHGIYKWIAKLPQGKHLWPALWMYSWDCWPPEIDVMEAWTNSCGGYFNGLNMGINTNVHYTAGNLDTMKHLPSKYCLDSWPSKGFNEYKLMWDRTSMQFFYNDKLFRTIEGYPVEWTNKNIEHGMNVIMNLHPTEDYKKNDMKEPLIVKSFEYIPFQTEDVPTKKKR